MVSLKKEQHIREYTPEHLMDEEESIRGACPLRTVNVKTTDCTRKIAIADNETVEKTEEKRKSKFDFSEIATSIICGLIVLFFAIGAVYFFMPVISGDLTREAIIKTTEKSIMCLMMGGMILASVVMIKKLLNCFRR